MNKTKKIIILAIGILLVLTIAFLVTSSYYLSPVSKKYQEKNVIIPSGSGYSDIAKILKNENLIKNEKFFLLYLKLKKVDKIYAAGYYLSPNMNLKEIVKTLVKGGHNESEITITFNEGINMRKIASIIDHNTTNNYEDVMDKLKDQVYLDSIIKEYWFLDDSIKNEQIYYSLEGYLFPDTYRFESENVSVEDIFSKMLNKMDNVLSNYKDKINGNKYTIHELLTIASITQTEGFTHDDFKNIASVFFNRLNNSMYLGSCVTSYYGVKKDMTEELFIKEINDSNSYNTRGTNAVLFPVGPISNPGLNAIDAVMNPINTSYYYFVSDTNNKLYFTKNENEHESIIRELQEKGLWYEW